MVTIYSASIDTSLTLPIAIDNVTVNNASVINTLRGAILAIESELGVKPSGVYATVRERLDYLESLFTSGGGGGGTVIFAGDLFGNSIAQTVVGIQNTPIS